MMEIKVKDLFFKDFMKCVDALNAFFSSEYKIKNFPMIEDEDDSVESTIYNIMKWMDSVDPTWIDNPDKIEESIVKIRDVVDKLEDDEDGNKDLQNVDEYTMDLITSLVAYKTLQFMSEHKTDMETLFQGIYSLDLFKTPSKYKDVIRLFSEPVQAKEINGIADNDVGACIFNPTLFVNGLFHNEYITMPSTMKPDIEIERIKECRDRTDIEIVVDKGVDLEKHVEESFFAMERAEINFFEETNPPHIKYHEDLKKWQISKQFTAAITRFLAGLKTCDTVDDIEEFINTSANRINPDDYTCMVLPVIIARVFANPKKFKNRVFDEKALKKYTDSYDSIIKQNKGAQRFKKYDLFTVFKTDKEGTLRFLEDFLTLKLVSDPNAYIQNHELLILFNIFDSRIYFDILFNVMPKSVQENEWKNEDNFVKTIRARLNANSRKSNPYEDANKKPVDNTVQNIDEVTEYVNYHMSKYRDLTISDVHFCEDIRDMIHMEIDTLDSKVFEECVSPVELYHESFLKPRAAMNGELPNYMKDRLGLEEDEDEEKTGTSKQDVEQVDVPEGVPSNPIDDLADSVETRANVFGQDGKDLDDAFGADADVNPVDGSKPHKRGQVIYNITYNNSFNKTNNDMSENKSITKSVRTNSHDIKNSTIKGSLNASPSESPNNEKDTKETSKEEPVKTQQETPKEAPSNSNNNGTPSANTSEETSKNTSENTDAFSTGKTVQEVFAMLYSKEPLFVEEGAGNPPKPDSLTRAIDADVQTMSMHQEAKRGIQKGINTVEARMKPIERTKRWLNRTIDGLIKKDEDQVKRELIDDPSYRSTVYRASRLAIKLGLTATAFALNPYLGFIVGGIGIARELDKNRLRKEAQQEYATEIKIIEEEIKHCDDLGYGADQAQKNKAFKKKKELMRLKAKMLNQAASLTNTPLRKVQEFT